MHKKTNYKKLMVMGVMGIILVGPVEARYLMDLENSIKQDFKNVKNLPKNAIKSTKRVGDATADLADSAVSGRGNLIKSADDFLDKTARRQALAKMSVEELQVLSNPNNYDEQTKQDVANKYSYTYAKMRGIDMANTNLYDSNKLDQNSIKDKKGISKKDTVAFTDSNSQNKDVFYDANKINQGDNFVRALGHENSRHDQIQKGQVNKTNDGISTELDQQALSAGRHNVGALKQEMYYKDMKQDSNSNGQVTYQRSQYDKMLISEGTKKANNVNDVQPLIASELLIDSMQSSPFQKRVHPITQQIINHEGDDTFTFNENKSFHAAADGKVIDVRNQTRIKKDANGNDKMTGWGNLIKIEHVDDKGNPTYRTLYAHAEKLPNFKVGDTVKEGQVLGTMGKSGGATGKHLHFEVEEYNSVTKKWRKIDPRSVNVGKYEKLSDIPKSNI